MQEVAAKFLVALVTAVTPPLMSAPDKPGDNGAGAALAAVNTPGGAAAADATGGDAPDRVLGQTVGELVALVRAARVAPGDPEPAGPDGQQNKDPPAGGPGTLAAAVEARLAPLLDLDTMTRLVVGRNWRLASEEQKAALIAEFRTLLVHTCLSVLSHSPEENIEFKSLPAPGDAAGAIVRSYAGHAGGGRLVIDYDMRRTDAGWKVVDIAMGGISLVSVYREAFAEQARDGGIEGLLAWLAAKRREGGRSSSHSGKAVPFALMMMHAVAQRGLIGRG